MFMTLRHTAMITLSVSTVIGCSMQTTTPGAVSSSTAAVPEGHFSLNTPVEKIAANQDGKAVLNRDIPGLMSNSNYMMVQDMSLSQIAAMSGGRLTKATLDQVQTDLSQLPATP